MFTKTVRFVKTAVNTAVNTIGEFVTGFFRHTETVVVLSLSAVGASALIGQIPFYMTTPLWIEAPMVIPVLGMLTVLSLVKVSEFRHPGLAEIKI